MTAPLETAKRAQQASGAADALATRKPMALISLHRGEVQDVPDQIGRLPEKASVVFCWIFRGSTDVSGPLSQ